MDENERNAKRITDLESTLMHLQNDFDSLNSVVLGNVDRLDRLNAMLEKLTHRMESKSESGVERNLEDEKPPHY